NKSDVRWSAVTDRSGTGLLFAGGKLFDTSVHHYSTGDLTMTKHRHKLTRLDETIVKLDAAQSGIGNHSCGYAPTLEQYLIRPEPMAFKLRLKPFSMNESSPMRLSRTEPV
ncbi:beta-galactosidase subunit alpha, partial [Paenibacillus sepulcri]|nr:beta-galactosidase subunit alpha [Paenibacillus sepulcri]